MVFCFLGRLDGVRFKERQIYLYIAFGIILFTGLMHLGVVLNFFKTVLGLVIPVLIGLLVAFVLNVPMTGIEHLLQKMVRKWKYKPKNTWVRTLSLILTLSTILLVLVFAGRLIVPALVESVKSIYPLVEEKWPEWMAYLETYESDLTVAVEWVKNFDIKTFTSKAGSIWKSALEAATSTISGITDVGFGLVIAIYVLLGKDKLAWQCQKFVYAHVKESLASRIICVAKLIRDTYAKFLSGQTMEAIILGCLVFIAYTIFQLPYAGLIAFLTSIFSFIPYIGAYAACALGSFLILLVEPSQLVLGICVYFTVQFIENQFIYPYVVGTSVGLSALWTLIAALIGGKLFGLLGIIFFIPFAAVLYTLVREDTNRRLREKGLLDQKQDKTVAVESEKKKQKQKIVEVKS